MIELALLFLLLGVVAGLLGFTRMAGTSFAIAKVIAIFFLILFLIVLVIGAGVLATLF